YTSDFYLTSSKNEECVRGFYMLLRWDATLRAHDKDTDGALESCQALLYFARTIGDDPMRLPCLIRITGHHFLTPALERSLAQGASRKRPLEAAASARPRNKRVVISAAYLAWRPRRLSPFYGPD